MKCHDSKVSNILLSILHSLNGDTRHKVLFYVHVRMTMYSKIYFLKMIFFFSRRICYNSQRVIDNLNVLNHRSLKLQIIVKLPQCIKILSNITYFIFNVYCLSIQRSLLANIKLRNIGLFDTLLQIMRYIWLV